MATDLYPAIAVLGPTGSGKSALALALALRFGGEILSCDALQVYRGMDIGTAKPSAAERAAVPHHLLDVREPDRFFSAGDYQDMGRAALDDIRARRHIPVVVGGTGFYFRALTEGLFEGPGRFEELRRRLRAIADRGGTPRLHRALGRVDAAAAERISPADSGRITRAYEVYLATGKTMSWWQARPLPGLTGFRWLKIAIEWPRSELYARIDARVDAMFRSGLVAEVESLLRQFPRESHAFKAIGYRQVAAYLGGETGLEQAVEETSRETRRYAKRQLTWFRADRDICWLPAGTSEDALIGEAAIRAATFLGERDPGTIRH
jgi:tRNA dimethylallyltransferase